MDRIRIGTRGSRLALKQAELVQEAIRQADGGIAAELVILHTKGDKILDKPLAEIGDKGLFVSEFEQALLEDRIDLAVHSAKDLPMHLAAGLKIAAVLPRADVRDVLVVKKDSRLPVEFADRTELPKANGKAVPEKGRSMEGDPGRASEQPFVMGTGSKRRQVQAQRLWSSVSCELIRGNVETRLKKLEDGRYDGILLAKAGLDRLNINAQTDPRFDFHVLSPEDFLPAACQGIIAVEAKDNSAFGDLLMTISDERTYLDFLVEQEVLTQLEADCSEAAAAWCRQKEGSLLLDVMYGENRVSLCKEANKETGLRLAEKAARLVKSDGRQPACYCSLGDQ